MSSQPSLLHRTAVLVYGFVSYAIGFVTLCYTAGFLGDFLVSKSIDSPASGPLWQALLINGGLLVLFGVQHTVMARPTFKRWFTRIIPSVAERSTYVLFSSLLMIALFVAWQPMGGVVWHVEHHLGRVLLYSGFAVGWVILFAATFYINHFDLFGLRQVWLHFRNRPYTSLKFATPGPYRIVRHPLYVGWISTFWFTPTMTVAHLFFAIMTTAYILIAIRFEERNLEEFHPEYVDYKRRTPMLVPNFSADVPTPRRAFD